MELESNLANGYLEAYKIASHELAQKDPIEISLNSNAEYDHINNTLKLKYLNSEYIVNCSNGDISSKDVLDVTTTVKVLILHYLLNAKTKPLTGNLISFKDIQGGGAIYNQTFTKRAILPLVKTFANNLDSFYKAAAELNGYKEKYGHASITIKVFPLVPVTYVLWQGDEEFGPNGTILFDSSITSYLPAEDIVLAASFGVYQLMGRR